MTQGEFLNGVKLVWIQFFLLLDWSSWRNFYSRRKWTWLFQQRNMSIWFSILSLPPLSLLLEENLFIFKRVVPNLLVDDMLHKVCMYPIIATNTKPKNFRSVGADSLFGWSNPIEATCHSCWVAEMDNLLTPESSPSRLLTASRD